jgi:hypothetical protein
VLSATGSGASGAAILRSAADILRRLGPPASLCNARSIFGSSIRGHGEPPCTRLFLRWILSRAASLLLYQYGALFLRCVLDFPLVACTYSWPQRRIQTGVAPRATQSHVPSLTMTPEIYRRRCHHRSDTGSRWQHRSSATSCWSSLCCSSAPLRLGASQLRYPQPTVSAVLRSGSLSRSPCH